MPTEVDRAWLAGMIDGEGCIGIYMSNGSCAVNFNVCNRCVPALDEIQGLFGGLVRGNNHHKASYWYPPRPLTPFVCEIIDYLRIKKEQARLVLEYYAISSSWPTMEVKQDFVARSKALNQRYRG